MNSAVFDWFWKTTLLPGGLVFAVALAAWWLLGRSGKVSRPGLVAFLGSLAALLGGLTAYVALNRWPAEFPPTQSWQWIAFITIAAAPIAALSAFAPAEGLLGHGCRWAARIIFPIFSVCAIFWSLWERKVVGPGYEYVPGIALGLAILSAWPWERAERRGFRGFFLAGALAAWAGAAAVMLILVETARLGQVGGAMACAITGLLIPAALAPRLPSAVGAWLPGWLAALCAVGYWSTDSTSAAGFIILGLAPLALILWPRATDGTPLPQKELTLRIAALTLYGLALLGALGLTYADSLKKAAADESGEYY